MMQMTIFVLKVSRMAMKMSNGETVAMMTSLIMMVSSPKLIMKIDIGIKMILTTLFVLQLSEIATKMPSGATVKMMTSWIVKVSFMKVTWSLTSELRDTNGFLCAKGKPAGDEDVEWRDSDYDDLVDSDGKSHETFHEN